MQGQESWTPQVLGLGRVLGLHILSEGHLCLLLQAFHMPWVGEATSLRGEERDGLEAAKSTCRRPSLSTCSRTARTCSVKAMARSWPRARRADGRRPGAAPCAGTVPPAPAFSWKSSLQPRRSSATWPATGSSGKKGAWGAHSTVLKSG